MRIGGLQKMTLLDYPGKVACTIFLAGCNMRCPYCHNGGLVLPERMEGEISREELMDFLSRRQGKLDGVCVTGGEPTINKDLPELIRQIRDLDFAVKLDTNGSNPGMLAALLQSGMIQYVAMDIKNCPAAYGETCGNGGLLEAVTESMNLLKLGQVPYEFRTTVCKPLHNVERIRELARWISGTERYYLQNFVDSGNLVGEGMTAFSAGELEALARAAREFVPNAVIRGQ